jgi:transcriptional regulator with XRE-family HTH domain
MTTHERVQGLDTDAVKRRLRLRRHELGLSQREASEKAGVSKSVIEKYESRHNNRIPNTAQLFRLVEVYGVSTDFILKGGSVNGKD